MKYVCSVCGWEYDESAGYPEGGIAPQEAQAVIAAGGKAATLGPRILRTETAGLVALTLTLHCAGEMGEEA